MALIAWTVLWENIGSLQRGSKFWESWEGTEYPRPSDTLDQNLDNGKLSDADVPHDVKAQP